MANIVSTDVFKDILLPSLNLSDLVNLRRSAPIHMRIYIEKKLKEFKRCHDISFHNTMCLNPWWREDNKCVEYCESLPPFAADKYFWYLIHLFKTNKSKLMEELDKLEEKQLEYISYKWEHIITDVYFLILHMQDRTDELWNPNELYVPSDEDSNGHFYRGIAQNMILNFGQVFIQNFQKDISNYWLLKDAGEDQDAEAALFKTFDQIYRPTQYLDPIRPIVDTNSLFEFIADFFKNKHGSMGGGYSGYLLEDEEKMNPLVSKLSFPVDAVIDDLGYDIGKFMRKVPTSRLIREWSDLRGNTQFLNAVMEIEKIYPNSAIRRWDALRYAIFENKRKLHNTHVHFTTSST
jgi:hypothetical protein